MRKLNLKPIFLVVLQFLIVTLVGLVIFGIAPPEGNPDEEPHLQNGYYP